MQDNATGLTYMQQRYYDAAIGRTLSVDPVTAYTSGDMRHFNVYTYANNNPYKFTDPDGRIICNRIRSGMADCQDNGPRGPQKSMSGDDCRFCLRNGRDNSDGKNTHSKKGKSSGSTSDPIGEAGPGMVLVTDKDGQKMYIHESYVEKYLAGRGSGNPYNYYDKSTDVCTAKCVVLDLTIGEVSQRAGAGALGKAIGKTGQPSNMGKTAIRNVVLPGVKKLGPAGNVAGYVLDTAPSCAEQCAVAE